MKFVANLIIRLFISLAIIFGIAACASSTRGFPKSTDTSSAIEVAYLASLKPALDAVNACIASDSGLALFLSETQAENFNTQEADLTLWLGPPPENQSYAVPLAYEEIAVVINAHNPVQAFTQEELKAILRGEITQWNSVGGENRKINVWIYPKGDEIQTLAENRLVPGVKIASTALTAPGPEAMVESISGDPGALGFLPLAWQNSEIKTIQIRDSKTSSLREPVLALTSTEPERSAQNPLYTFLLCMQGPTGQKALTRHYEPLNP